MMVVAETPKRYSQVRPVVTQLAAILIGCAGVLSFAASAALARAQRAEPAESRRPVAKAEPPSAVVSEAQIDPRMMDATRDRLNEALGRYPRVADVIFRDPSLLSNQEYITSNAPGLWQFLEQHPEISRDPEFFLSGRLRRVGFERRDDDGDPVLMRITNDLWPFMVFVIITAALLWILRVILENRRWSRLAQTQAEVHNKLLEKFSGSQELLAYIATEPGKRFLESAPIPVDLEQRPRFSAPLGRIIWSLQLGLILGLGGAGLLYIRGRVPDGDQPLLVFGTLGVTFGTGFILSAIVSYALSKHLGLFDRTPSSLSSTGELGQAREQ
jgi:hypothetical protein